MKKILLSVLFTSLIVAAFGQTPFQDEFLNLNDNQPPANWNWVVELDAAALQNGRMEAYQVDAAGHLRRTGTMPLGIDSICFEWDGSLSYAYWGQSSGVRIIVGGKLYDFWHGFDQYNYGSNNNVFGSNVRNINGTNIVPMNMHYPPLSFSNFHHKLSFHENKVYFEAIDLITDSTYFKNMDTIPDTDFLVPNIQEFQFRLGCTTDNNIWMDNLKVSLFSTTNCANNLSITAPLSQNSGSSVTLNAATSDPNPVYRWQSDLGLGFQDLSNYGQYLGVGSNNLQVANLQLRNHQQKFRVISNSGNCIDTSALATIALNDTCINVVNDTNLITVTDTLRIVITAASGLVQNTLKAYPNPTAGMLFINTGNYAVMPGYSIRISSATGQEVYNSVVNQPLLQVPLENLSPEGLFYLRLYDASGTLVTTRKIVLQ
jgi:hypothetical protein